MKTCLQAKRYKVATVAILGLLMGRLCERLSSLVAPESEAVYHAFFYLLTFVVNRYVYSFQLLLQFNIARYSFQVYSIVIRPLCNL